MSDLPERDPLSIPWIVAAKGREKIAMLTVYDAPSARLLDEAGIEILLVGDSVEMTVYGEPNTLSATMDQMVRHTRAVARATKRAVENAGRFLAEAGCAAVKVEGGRRILPAVQAILAADIPVMGHVGLTPQSVRKLGGFKVQGREEDSAREIREDAKALADAGCFAVVLECVPETLAAQITAELPVPTLGIGAGPHCDGQVLVYHDVMGLAGDFRPKFVRKYADLSAVIRDAAGAFVRDVKSGGFPSKEESFTGARPPLRRVH